MWTFVYAHVAPGVDLLREGRVVLREQAVLVPMLVPLMPSPLLVRRQKVRGRREPLLLLLFHLLVLLLLRGQGCERRRGCGRLWRCSALGLEKAHDRGLEGRLRLHSGGHGPNCCRCCLHLGLGLGLGLGRLPPAALAAATATATARRVGCCRRRSLASGGGPRLASAALPPRCCLVVLVVVVRRARVIPRLDGDHFHIRAAALQCRRRRAFILLSFDDRGRRLQRWRARCLWRRGCCYYCDGLRQLIIYRPR